ncbi:MAG: autotransporter outer membrane beta-barrel domain-containing protein [Alphaproteobacteria bacterium]|jgi:uncharacterized protein with beta-barrel porin domain|nr:autotransporter outer membrane beta-barrel domain-containing protein [Alphaproteobacteria bacterium]
MKNKLMYGAISFIALSLFVASSAYAEEELEADPNDTTLTSTSSTLQPTVQATQTILATNAVFDRLASMNIGYPSDISGLSSGDEKMGVNLWAAPYLTFAKDTNSATAYDSDTQGIFFGADYKVAPRLTAGLMLGVDHTEVDSQVNGGGADTVGVTVAPYGRYMLNKTYAVDASMGYTNSSSDNDRIDAGTVVTGNSDVDRFFFSVGFNGNWWQDRWNFSGRVATSNSYDDSDAYTESNGTAVGSKSTSFGQVQVGGTASYYFENVRPWMSMTYAYDYNRKLPTVAATQQRPSDDRDQFVLGYGATLFNVGMVTADLSVKHTLFKEKYDNTNIGLSLSTSF